MEEQKGLYKFNEIEKRWQANWESGKTSMPSIV